MPSINYALKYSPKVDERFKLGPLTNALISNQFDWIGVEAVKVFSVGTVSMNDYSLTGSARYGTASELENAVQTMTLTQDRSFTFTIDRKSEQDTMGTMAAGAALRRQIDEVVIPEVDAYRLAAMVAGAGSGNYITTTPTSSNAYSLFLDLQEKLDEKKVPIGGRIAIVTPAYYNLLKLDNNFIKASDIGQNMLIRGQVGEVDGIRILKAPSSYFPENVNAILTIPVATVSPVKLQDFKIHDNPPGINGFLCEGRIRYDCFVLNNKADGIAYLGPAPSTT